MAIGHGLEATGRYRLFTHRYILPTKYLAVYYPTPDPIITRMMKLAGLGKEDVVFDLGCGDGRGE